jgi:predicted TIM-barrel fold metal-dependent hydrolase
LPSLCARFDSAWRVMRDEVPELPRRPSDYLRERVWFTSQPIEEPEDPAWLPEVLAYAGVSNRLMFSTDYPHWDFDNPFEAIPRSLPDELCRRIYAGNACELYGLRLGERP